MKQVLNVCLFVALALLPRFASGDALECLSAAKGKYISWDATWDRHHLDGGVLYRILEIQTRYTYPSKAQRVELVPSAPGPAALPFRKISVQDEKLSEAICSRLAETIRLPTAPGAVSLTKVRRHTEEARLPYILYSDKRWVRAELPSAEPLAKCTVLLKQFACTESDKLQHYSALKQLEEELLWQAE